MWQAIESAMHVIMKTWCQLILSCISEPMHQETKDAMQSWMNKPKQGCHALPWDPMHPCLGALPIHLTMWETQRTCFKLAVAIHLWLHSPCIFYKVLLCRNVRQCHSLSSAPGRMTRRLCQQLSIHPPQSPYSGPTSMFCGSQSGPPNGPWPCAYNT